MNKLEQELVRLLATILNCGYADIDFLIKICDDFRVDISDAWIQSRDMIPNFDINTLIYSVYNIAIDDAISEVFSDIDKYDFSSLKEGINVYCNCLDSHLQIEDVDGDIINIYDYDGLLEVFETYL